MNIWKPGTMDHPKPNIKGNEANCNKEDLNMSFEEGNEETPVEVDGEEEPSNFLEENLKEVHSHFERLNTILHESNEEIPFVAEVVMNSFHQMTELKIDLESKYAELRNLAGDLHLVSSSREPDEHLLRMQQSAPNTTPEEEGRISAP